MEKVTFKTQSKLRWVLITIFHRTFFFFKSRYTLYNQIQHTYNVWNSVYYTCYCLCVCTEWLMAAQGSDVIKGVKPPKFRKEFWKKYKESITGLCSMKTCACAYDSSCKWLKEKGNTSEWSYVDISITETKCKSNV